MFALVAILMVACDGGNEEARPAPVTTSSPTTTTTRSAPTCRSPVPVQAAETTEIQVFFYCGDYGGVPFTPLVPVVRRVPKNDAVLQAVMEAFVRGPTREEAAAGFGAAVPLEATQAAVRVELQNGLAAIAIDYDLGSISNFSASNPTITFYQAFYANAFQFRTVKAVDLIGQCPGEVECTPVPRSEWEGGSWVPTCPPQPPPNAVCRREK